MEIGYESKDDGEVTVVKDATSTPISRFPPSTYRRLYEIASVDVSFHLFLLFLFFVDFDNTNIFLDIYKITTAVVLPEPQKTPHSLRLNYFFASDKFFLRGNNKKSIYERDLIKPSNFLKVYIVVDYLVNGIIKQ